MNEPVKKPVAENVPAASGQPGGGVGSAPAAPVAAALPAAPIAGLAGGKAVPDKKPFGGNVGKKPTGFKPGSPEAVAEQRRKDADRKRREREERRAVTPPPALPAGTPPPVAAVAPPPDAAAGFVADLPVDPVLAWTPDDFRGCAVELVELAEAWRVECHTKRAVEGKLPAAVVKEIAGTVGFPAASKKSLATSSPVTLAKMFNSLKVPRAVKPVITTAPALVYIIVRDLQTSSRIEKLIAEHGEHQKAAAEN